MKRFNNKGFSLLHILPVVVIVGIIAFVGVKIMRSSNAAVYYGVSCAASWGTASADRRVPFAIVYKNNFSTRSPGTLTAFIAQGYGGMGNSGTTRVLPGLLKGQTYVWRGAMGPYAKGTRVTLGAGYHRFNTNHYNCTGQRTYQF